ncbi:hypothetical protein [Massilia scottii]|uniref:hypothetical protein n=1 Tax=Massilia scottii TaxID=3057166 RepID=UPI00279665F7|nr:hypothetical protein [Massilia sp. CCM 9029]MDQ1831943.1 hypothetical protein [Massilia sp. CCM 9029]
MDTTNNPHQTTLSCPLCCARANEPHSDGCQNSVPPRITMTPLLRRALQAWSRAVEGDEGADLQLLDLLNLMAGPAGAFPSTAVPAGMVLVPVRATNAISFAIEEEIDDQLEESGIAPRDMVRQDSDRVWDAAIQAAQKNASKER